LKGGFFPVVFFFFFFFFFARATCLPQGKHKVTQEGQGALR
jgi:hypothetical protein